MVVHQHNTRNLEHELEEVRTLLKQQSIQLQQVQSQLCSKCCNHSKSTDSIFTILLVLTLIALLKCLVTVELVNQRLDALGAAPLKLAPRPWAPFLWMGHLVGWIGQVCWSHLSSLVERILAVLVTGIIISFCVLFFWGGEDDVEATQKPVVEAKSSDGGEGGSN
jgi:hypothetical protein